jgi:hypothetical protein
MEKTAQEKMKKIWSHPASTEAPLVILKALERASREYDMSWLQARDSDHAIKIAGKAIDLVVEEVSRLQEVIGILRRHPEAIYYHSQP